MLYVYARGGKGVEPDKLSARRRIVRDYADKQRLRIDGWLSASSCGSCLKELQTGDTLLTPEISCLGKTLSGINKTIAECIRRKIKLIIISGDYVFEDNPGTKLLLSAMDIIIRFQSELKSQLMRDKLQQLRRQGRKLGRPTGSCNKALKLDGREQEIKALLEQKLSKTAIAKILGVNRMTLYSFLRRMQKIKMQK